MLLDSSRNTTTRLFNTRLLLPLAALAISALLLVSSAPTTVAAESGQEQEIPPGSRNLETGERQSYTWSEASETARVPKSFLDQISIFSVWVTNYYANHQFVLRDEFIKVFKLTKSEMERVNDGIAAAIHEYRTVEGQQLEPTDEEPNMMRKPWDRPGVIEILHFRMTPFPETARAIHQRLEEVVRLTLGEQRSKYFWEYGGLITTALDEAKPKPPLRAGTVRSTIFTYLLRESKPGFQVEIYKANTTRRLDGAPGGGGGMSGQPPGESLDQYAPEKMKPILARWKKMGAKREVERATSDAAVEATPVIMAEWDDASPFVDLPKSLLQSIRVPGLTLDGEISPEAVMLFGLTPPEVTGVRSLYDELKARFEQFEREHFERVEPGKDSFVLHPFPKESEALQEEWTTRLKDLIGGNRAELLDHSIRTAPNPMRIMRRGQIGPDRFRRFRNRGPDWLHRGTDKVHVDVSSGPIGRDGQPRFRIEYRTEREGGGRGSWTGRREEISERWKHLLPPEILGLPEVF